MIDFLCQMPGLDQSTATWHAAIHFGLAGFVAITGSVFLGLGVVAYRRPPEGR